MYAIEVNNVTKKFVYEGKEFYALNNVSFNVKEGEIFGLLGPNGAGKSTLLNMMINMLHPDNGSIKVLGVNPNEDRNVLGKISFLSGESRFHWALKPIDIMNFYAKAYGLKKSERIKKINELVDLFEIKDIMNKKYDFLSTGERMRLAFAKCLINNPKLLLLDEPTLGLDPDISTKVRKEIKRMNKELKKTILLTSHYMHEVELLSNRIAFMNKGRILDVGKVKDVLSKHFSTYNLIVILKEIKNKSYLNNLGFKIKGKKITKEIFSGEDIDEILSSLTSKYKIVDLKLDRPTLEDYFVQKSRGGKD
ncbi:ABC transporter ATP-binding protein [Candidatus Woesearchaeota archaeon]|nr:ABC transporter ATP-binding protein [Candidatus Woesearchaeota archaeon]